MIVDLFAGVGWAVGLRSLGHAEVGFDVDPAVCRNRARFGLSTIRADVSSWPLEPLHGRVRGLLASPPCQDWSAAGRRAGRAGETGWLVDEPLGWVLELRPRWAAWEQVPEALPVWETAAPVLRAAGYSVWCGILNSADVGVPQTRRRAILMASLDQPAHPPPATHARDPQPSLFGPPLRPWVTMADALGWDGTLRPGVVDGRNRRRYRADEPAPTVCFGHDAASWVWERPATTVCADPRLGAPGHRDRAGGEPQFGDESVRLTIGEALTLQGFPPGFELVGTKTEQFQIVGNAVPPPLARAVVAELDPPF